jgi:hypothetical protein
MANSLSKYLFIFQLVLMGALSIAQADNQQNVPPPLTDAQKKCFSDNDVSPPDLSTPAPNQEVVEKIRTCLEENGFKAPPPTLTDAQKKCFTDNGVVPPERDSPPQNPLPHKNVRDKIRACLDANGFKTSLQGSPAVK